MKAEGLQLSTFLVEPMVEDKPDFCANRTALASSHSWKVYVSWHSQPDFVARSVQSIAKVALTIASVARGEFFWGGGGGLKRSHSGCTLGCGTFLSHNQSLHKNISWRWRS